jgi:hypothetical protein
MNYRKLKVSVLLLFLGLVGLSAQEVIPASGGNASGSGGSASFSVGQLMFNTHTGTNGSVAEGVQQPYEISTITGIEEVLGIDLVSSVYPNPTADFLTLRVEDNLNMELSYQLFDIGGRLLKINKVTENETTIDMVRFSAGTYFLKITDNNRDVKTFKIIKY